MTDEIRFIQQIAQRVSVIGTVEPAGTRRLVTHAIVDAVGAIVGLPQSPLSVVDGDLFIRRRLSGELLGYIRVAGDPLDCFLRAARLYEALVEVFSDTGRRASGSYFTPPAIARYVAENAVEGLPGASFCDPACGAGSLLVALAISHGIPARNIYGMDTDPLAVEMARALVWMACGARDIDLPVIGSHIRVQDALQSEFPPAEVMVANPPFVKGVIRRSSADQSARAALKARLPGLSGAFDLASAFWALGEREKCRRMVMVLPNRLLAAGYTVRLRNEAVRRRDSVTMRDFSRSKAFGPVAVYPVVVTLSRDGMGKGQTLDGSTHFHWDSRILQDHNWSATLKPAAMQVLAARPVRLGEVATVTAGQTAAEAYALQPKIRKRGQYILVTAGAVEPHWIDEASPQRFLGKNFRLPRVAARDLGQNRARIAAMPKLLVSAMGRQVEAALDLQGRYAPAVSVFAVVPKPGSQVGLGALSAILNSRIYGPLFRSLYGAQAMSGGYISVTKSMLLDLPLGMRLDRERLKRLEAVGLALAELPLSSELREEADELVLGLFGKIAKAVATAGD